MIADEIISAGIEPIQQQEKLLQEYCSDLEHHISAAASKSAAVKIAEESCGQFHYHCSSDILLRHMDLVVQKLIITYWGND